MITGQVPGTALSTAACAQPVIVGSAGTPVDDHRAGTGDRAHRGYAYPDGDLGAVGRAAHDHRSGTGNRAHRGCAYPDGDRGGQPVEQHMITGSAPRTASTAALRTRPVILCGGDTATPQVPASLVGQDHHLQDMPPPAVPRYNSRRSPPLPLAWRTATVRPASPGASRVPRWCPSVCPRSPAGHRAPRAPRPRVPGQRSRDPVLSAGRLSDPCASVTRRSPPKGSRHARTDHQPSTCRTSSRGWRGAGLKSVPLV
jgi:hypothetical protein